MPYVTFDTSVEVDFWTIWDDLAPYEKDEILKELHGDPEADEVAQAIYEVRYLDLYKDKSTLEVLEMVANKIETS